MKEIKHTINEKGLCPDCAKPEPGLVIRILFVADGLEVIRRTRCGHCLNRPLAWEGIKYASKKIGWAS